MRTALQTLASRIVNALRRTRARRDIDEELRFHVDQLTADNIRAGMTPGEARRQALISLGGVQQTREEYREALGWRFLAGIAQDLRYGVRQLRRSPVFALFTIGSLALGIGATTAIFSLFDAIVLRKLPVPEPERLVQASMSVPGRSRNHSMPYPHFERMRSDSTTLEGLFAVNPMGRVSVAFQGRPELATADFVSGDYYRVLGLQPAMGRLLSADDDRPGNTVAVISHGYWQRRFGGSPEVVGAGIRINEVPFTIVGVEPPGFFGIEVGRAPDIAIPMRTRDLLSEAGALWDEAFATWIYILGRLRNDVALERAEQELNLIFRRVNEDAARALPPESDRTFAERFAREGRLHLEYAATGALSDLRNSYQRWLRLLLMLLGAVLLLASLNVATLLLSRAAVRQKEIATRMALGAGRWRIVRQLFTESALLAVFGCVLGLLLAWWGSGALLRIALSGPERLPVDVRPDVRVVGFTMALSALACLAFGLVPGLRSTSRRLVPIAREIGGRQRRLLDRTLVASQVALSLVLLIFAGLFLRTLQSLWAQNTGYDRRNVLMFSVDARLAGKRGSDVLSAYRRLCDELLGMPGVQSASLSSVRPVSDSYYFVSGVTEVGSRVLPRDARIRIAFNNVGPGYFATLGIPLLGGRDFDERDHPNASRVAIISEKMARHFEGNPLGQRIALGRLAYEVVGVARDTRYARVKDAPREVVYLPIFQSEPRNVWYTPTFEMRYAGSSGEVLRTAQEAVARVDPALVIFNAKTLEAQTEESLSRERLLAMLASYIGAFALLLACIGLYGLMNYTVAQRTPELGVRMALGARPANIRRMVFRESVRIVLVGLCIGVAGSMALARFVQSQLFGVQPNDPAALLGAALLLVALASLAAYLPAVRASRVDPMIALRSE